MTRCDDNGHDPYEYPRERREPHCKCGNPDLPGTCPGWRNCPMHGEGEELCSRCGDGDGWVETYSTHPPMFEVCPLCFNPKGNPCP
jgi:hypothetical protein